MIFREHLKVKKVTELLQVENAQGFSWNEKPMILQGKKLAERDEFSSQGYK